MKTSVHLLSAILAASAVNIASAQEAESSWRTGWDGTLYGYANTTHLRDNSLLNPDNRIARLTQHSATAELRLNIKAENDTLRFTARPIVLTQTAHNSWGSEQTNDGYLSQWQLRLRAGDYWNVAVGRDLLNWGPAQFRSPSSPFYFDNGRSNPMRELSGMDSVKLSWTPDMQSSVSLVRIIRSGHDAAQPDVWRNSWLLKYDQRGNAWAYGLVAARSPETGTFHGAHGQITVSDAVLLYGELGSSSLASSLESSSNLAKPFSISKHSPRRTTSLIGASFTFEDGKSLAAEYLHTEHGYTSAQEDAYFRRAIATPGLALGFEPRLLGRDYLHFVWQSNMMDNDGHWRLMYTRNLTDRSHEFAGYGEMVLSPHVTAFALASVPLGDKDQELSALVRGRLTLGIKIALP